MSRTSGPLLGWNVLKLSNCQKPRFGTYRPLKGLRNLRKLSIPWTKPSRISDLESIKNRRVLRLANVAVSEEEKTLLQRTLPQCGAA